MYSDVGKAVSSATCKPCGAGMYGAATGLAGKDQCSECPIGTFSSAVVLVTRKDCLECPAGKVSMDFRF